MSEITVDFEEPDVVVRKFGGNLEVFFSWAEAMEIRRALNVLATQREASYNADPCIHPGLFDRGRTTEHCGTCGRDVPQREL